MSEVVQPLPSLHSVPSGRGVLVQAPVAGLQTPTVRQASGVVGQTRGAPGVHTPARHMSTFVHALPSLHIVPSGFGALEQAPVVGSQTPAVWQASPAEQTTGVPAVQTPARQTSPVV